MFLRPLQLQILDAYRTFGKAAENKAFKMTIEATGCRASTRLGDDHPQEDVALLRWPAACWVVAQSPSIDRSPRSYREWTSSDQPPSWVLFRSAPSLVDLIRHDIRNELKVAAVRPMPGFDESHVLGLAALASSDGGQDPVDAAIRSATSQAVASDLPKPSKFVPFTGERHLDCSCGIGMRNAARYP